MTILFSLLVIISAGSIFLGKRVSITTGNLWDN